MSSPPPVVSRVMSGGTYAASSLGQLISVGLGVDTAVGEVGVGRGLAVAPEVGSAIPVGTDEGRTVGIGVASQPARITAIARTDR
jgi:hypothetical protein